MATEAELQARIAASAARRKAKADAEKLPRLEQEAADLERVAELEEEHGSERVLVVRLPHGWTPGRGAATLVAALLPETEDRKFRRWKDLAMHTRNAKAADITEAENQFAASCIVYPDRKSEAEKAMYEATIQLAPGILGHVAAQVAEWVQGKAEERGK